MAGLGPGERAGAGVPGAGRPVTAARPRTALGSLPGRPAGGRLLVRRKGRRVLAGTGRLPARGTGKLGSRSDRSAGATPSQPPRRAPQSVRGRRASVRPTARGPQVRQTAQVTSP